jgi:putative ABC transport system permease protein
MSIITWPEARKSKTGRPPGPGKNIILMFSRDRWKEIVEVLTGTWFRTVLTAFGVFWGVLILIILRAAGKGRENGIESDFGGVATNRLFMW